MPTFGIFPTPIYSTLLEPPSAVLEAMNSYMLQFLAETNELSEPRNYDSGLYKRSFTGDTYSKYLLHQEPEFQWLNAQIKKAAFDYLESLGGDIDSMEVHAQKSWPVICLKGGHIESHIHKNSVLSAVYYLQIPETQKGGNLTFEDPSAMSSIPLRLGSTENHQERLVLTPMQNTLILFPSSLTHSVSPIWHLEDNKPRYSVSYDLVVSSTPNKEDIEMEIVSPSHWLKL